MMAKSPLLRMGDHVVALIQGGEPKEGCEWIEVVLSGRSRMDVIQHARALGVWNPSISSRLPSETEANAAIGDARGFVWRVDNGTGWRSSKEFAATFTKYSRAAF